MNLNSLQVKTETGKTPKLIIDSFEYASHSDTLDSVIQWDYRYKFVYHTENSGNIKLVYNFYVKLVKLIRGGYSGGGGGKGFSWETLNRNRYRYIAENVKDTITGKYSFKAPLPSSHIIQFTISGIYAKIPESINENTELHRGFFYIMRDTIYAKNKGNSENKYKDKF